MDNKVFWKSKTFWFNVLSLIAMVATSFGFGDFAADPQVNEYALVIVTVINLVLRFYTNKNLTLK